MEPATISTAGGRDTALDAARAFAVFAMVMGHTLHATLSLEVRAEPLVQTYWQFRGLTAPLFLAVSGWAVAVVTLRGGLDGVLRKRLPRVGLLLLLGYALRVPMWNLTGFAAFEPKLWRHFLAFDALHCVGTSLLLAAVIFQYVRSRALRTSLFAAVAIGIPLLSPGLWAAMRDAPLFLQQTFGGGTAPFPLFPWIAYFFAGALLGSLSQGMAPRTRSLWLLAFGAALVLVSGAIGMEAGSASRPDVFAARLGQVLLIVALVSQVPAGLARRLGPVGRASLGVYVSHLIVVYGWLYWPGLWNRVGRTLDLPQALGLGLVVFAGCYGLIRAAKRVPKTAAWVELWRLARSLRARGVTAAS